MDGWINGRLDDWIDEWMERLLNSLMFEWVVSEIASRTDVYMDG